MLARLALLFILVPVAELAILVRLGRAVGLGPTLGLVVVTGVLGAALARAEGLRVLGRFREEIARGRVPSGPLLDGLAVLVGGAFLLTPGLLTDLGGLLLLLPVTRRWLQRRAVRWVERGLATGRIQVRAIPGDPFAPFAEPHEPEGGRDPRHEIHVRPPEDPRSG